MWSPHAHRRRRLYDHLDDVPAYDPDSLPLQQLQTLLTRAKEQGVSVPKLLSHFLISENDKSQEDEPSTCSEDGASTTLSVDDSERQEVGKRLRASDPGPFPETAADQTGNLAQKKGGRRSLRVTCKARAAFLRPGLGNTCTKGPQQLKHRGDAPGPGQPLTTGKPYAAVTSPPEPTGATARSRA
ncbi:unnamed protein product, partial [Phaeothamnion confervicola]